MTGIITDYAPVSILAILSRPSFTVDPARGLPMAVTIAAFDPAIGQVQPKSLTLFPGI